MSLLQAYLQSGKTRQILSRKPGEKGFSLIELVVVIGVLAVLTAVALPNFLSVSDDASVRSAQQAMVSFFKECSVRRTRGAYTNAVDTNPVIPESADFDIGAATGTTTIDDSLALAAVRGEPNSDSCFTVSGESALNNVVAVPNAGANGKFATFFIDATTGRKSCRSGIIENYPETFTIGCKAEDENGNPAGETLGTW